MRHISPIIPIFTILFVAAASAKFLIYEKDARDTQINYTHEKEFVRGLLIGAFNVTHDSDKVDVNECYNLTHSVIPEIQQIDGFNRTSFISYLNMLNVLGDVLSYIPEAVENCESLPIDPYLLSEMLLVLIRPKSLAFMPYKSLRINDLEVNDLFHSAFLYLQEKNYANAGLYYGKIVHSIHTISNGRKTVHDLRLFKMMEAFLKEAALEYNVGDLFNNINGIGVVYEELGENEFRLLDFSRLNDRCTFANGMYDNLMRPVLKTLSESRHVFSKDDLSKIEPVMQCFKEGNVSEDAINDNINIMIQLKFRYIGKGEDNLFGRLLFNFFKEVCQY